MRIRRLLGLQSDNQQNQWSGKLDETLGRRILEKVYHFKYEHGDYPDILMTKECFHTFIINQQTLFTACDTSNKETKLYGCNVRFIDGPFTGFTVV